MNVRLIASMLGLSFVLLAACSSKNGSSPTNATDSPCTPLCNKGLAAVDYARQWIAKHGKEGRSRYYNHSTFADLLITGVVGLVPRADDVVEVYPLLPEGAWNYFCLDGVTYHGHSLTIFWDVDGTRYHRGPGLFVLADGKEIARADKLAKLTGKLP